MTDETVYQACKDGDLMFLREWLDNVETDPNSAIDQHQFTPLHWACWHGHMPLVDLLLAPPHSARIDVVNMGEDTPLHCAAQQGHANVIKRLLRDNLSAHPGGFRPNSQVNAMNRHGNTPLHYACFWGFKDAALELINVGANVSLCNRQNKTPLDVVKGRSNGTLGRELAEAAENTGQRITRIPFETAFEEISNRVRTIRPRDGTLGRLGKSGAGKLSLEEVQDLYPAPFGLCSHPWRELFHGIIPGGTPVVATRLIPPISADPKRVSRDFDSECKKLRVFSHANIHGVLSWINTPDFLFMLSELTPQFGSLYEVLHSRSDVKLQPNQLARIACNIASGMEFLVSRGTEHHSYQLTSKHVIITEELTAKLDMSDTKLSFEVPSREYNPEWCAPEALGPASKSKEESSVSSTSHSNSSVVPSHVNYGAAQMWSLGVIVWELITCQIPFVDMNKFHIGFKIVFCQLRLEAPPPSRLSQGPMTHLAKMMKMMRNEEPSQRPAFQRIVPILQKIQ